MYIFFLYVHNYIKLYHIHIYISPEIEAPNKQYAPEWKIAKIFTADHWEDGAGYPELKNAMVWDLEHAEHAHSCMQSWQ